MVLRASINVRCTAETRNIVFFNQKLMLTRLKELKEFLVKKRINVAFARVD